MSGSYGSFYSSVGQPPPFTLSQWHELEHQVLIFKYLKAGLSVPPDLLVPIYASLHLLSSLGYCSYYGKKIDPEPGRCRRTDGKKWRCSKDAHPGSKYCARHMNRSRYRSRKPVESQTASHSLSTAASDIGTGSCSGSGTFQNSIGNHDGLRFTNNVSQSLLDPKPYGTSNREYRCLQGLKAKADDGIISVASGKVRGLGINSSMDSEGCFTTSQRPANSLPDQINGAFVQNSCSQWQVPQDFDPLITNDAISKQQRQHYFFSRDFGSSRSLKQENTSLQPFRNELPKTIDFGYYLDDQQANKNSLSTTQLSISFPMASSEFAGRSAHSLKDASMEKFLS